ncbi:MAG TPA: hypothetical protein VGC97_14710 [Pyrinomonadaceae bacterium]|jgi:hypothetical protein
MKFNLLLVLFCLLVFTPAIFAQNTYKIFDSTLIDLRDENVPLDFNTAVAFQTKEMYLTCPLNPQSSLSGPGNTNLIVDNYLTVNGVNVCPGEDGQGSCFASTLNDPYYYLGEIMEVSYNGVAPINVSSRITGSGVYSFQVKDYGYTFGNTEIYLNTTCSTIAQVCHRDNGRRGQKTLTIDPGSVAAHLAHGDTSGPCAQ